jgi:hypothetical protein
MKTNFVKKKAKKKSPPLCAGIFGIFGFYSNPPSGIFGFYPGKGSAYSS